MVLTLKGLHHGYNLCWVYVVKMRAVTWRNHSTFRLNPLPLTEPKDLCIIYTEFPRASVTKHYQLGSLKKTEVYSLMFCKLGFWSPVVGTSMVPQTCRGILPCLFLVSGSLLAPCAVSGLKLLIPVPAFIVTWLSPCASAFTWHLLRRTPVIWE